MTLLCATVGETQVLLCKRKVAPAVLVVVLVYPAVTRHTIRLVLSGNRFALLALTALSLLLLRGGCCLRLRAAQCREREESGAVRFVVTLKLCGLATMTRT